MDLTTVLSIVRRWWWLVLGVFVMSVVATIVMLSGMPKVYQSTASFNIAPRSTIDVEVVKAIEAQGRTELNATYANFAESQTVKAAARDSLSTLTSEQRSSLAVSARVIPGTNIVEITGRASDPELASAFTAEVGVATDELMARPPALFTLQPIDQPSFSNSPVSPRVGLTLILGGALGLLLGIGLAVGAEIVLVGRPRAAIPEWDDRSDYAGTPTTRGYLPPPRGEAGPQRAYTLAVFRISGDHRPENGALEAAATTLDEMVRPQDVVWHLGEGRFVALVPRTEDSGSDRHVERYRRVIENELMRSGLGASVRVGVELYPIEVTDGDVDLAVQEILSGPYASAEPEPPRWYPRPNESALTIEDAEVVTYTAYTADAPDPTPEAGVADDPEPIDPANVDGRSIDAVDLADAIAADGLTTAVPPPRVVLEAPEGGHSAYHLIGVVADSEEGDSGVVLELRPVSAEGEEETPETATSQVTTEVDPVSPEEAGTPLEEMKATEPTIDDGGPLEAAGTGSPADDGLVAVPASGTADSPGPTLVAASENESAAPSTPPASEQAAKDVDEKETTSDPNSNRTEPEAIEPEPDVVDGDTEAKPTKSDGRRSSKKGSSAKTDGDGLSSKKRRRAKTRSSARASRAESSKGTSRSSSGRSKGDAPEETGHDG